MLVGNYFNFFMGCLSPYKGFYSSMRLLGMKLSFLIRFSNWIAFCSMYRSLRKGTGVLNAFYII